MPKLSLTKNELKRQKDALRRYRRYLPTLELKKRQLQREWLRVRAERRQVEEEIRREKAGLESWMALWSESAPLEDWLGLKEVVVRWESVAGLAVPVFVRVELSRQDHDLVRTPLWVDRALIVLGRLMEGVARRVVLQEQERRLHRELRVTSQRVNLFERVKIPEALRDIHRITVALNDAQTAAFGWALVARRKLERAA